jgi:hypothetical protein
MLCAHRRIERLEHRLTAAMLKLTRLNAHPWLLRHPGVSRNNNF